LATWKGVPKHKDPYVLASASLTIRNALGVNVLVPRTIWWTDDSRLVAQYSEVNPQDGDPILFDLDEGYIVSWRDLLAPLVNAQEPRVGIVSSALAEAIDATYLTVDTTGNAYWFRETSVYVHGGDAAQSGDVGDNQYSQMQTTVSGSGTISFQWKVSSELNYDWLECWIDGVRRDKISGSVNWTWRYLSVSGSGSHTVIWRYSKDGTMTSGSDCGWVDEVFWSDATLSDSIEWSGSLVTGGDEYWKGQRRTYYYGGDAAQSGTIGDNQSSMLSLTCSGPGTLYFYWKVSSEAGWDYLQFYADGVLQTRVSGAMDWTAQSKQLTGSGSHTFEWRYVKDGIVSSGSDCGWVDWVRWVDQGTLSPPTNVSATDGYSLWYVRVTWSPPSTGPTPDGYRVYRNTTTNPGTAALVSTQAGTTYTNSGAMPGVRYWYWVKSYKSGYSDSSFSSGNDGYRGYLGYTANEVLDNWVVWFSTYASGPVPGYGWVGLPSGGVSNADYARSGQIPNGAVSYLNTTVSGAYKVSFYWMVSSEANWDWLEFYIDGVRRDRISGSVGWTYREFSVSSSASHSLSWRYVKDGSGSYGSDLGGVDRLVVYR
jgi:hypothetical protein